MIFKENYRKNLNFIYIFLIDEQVYYRAFIKGISEKKRRIKQLQYDIDRIENHLEEYILFWGNIREFETNVNSNGSAIIEIINTEGEKKILITNYNNTCIKNQPKYGSKTFENYSLIHSENIHSMDSYCHKLKWKY